MRKIISVSIIWVLAAGLLFATDNERKPLGKVTFPLGDNFIQSRGTVKWQPVKYKMPVFEFDRIKTARQSRCEITFETKKVLRIGEKTIVEITQDDAGTHEVKLDKGSAWLSLFLPWGKSKINVKTPSSVCAVRGTVYRLEADSNHTAYRCYKGTIAVTPFKEDGKTLADSTFEVNAGEELILVMNFEEYKKQQQKQWEEFKQKEMDDFERFKQQDQQQFDEMLQKDLEDFNKVNNISYKQQRFDFEEDQKSDWVQWNKERDRLLQE